MAGNHILKIGLNVTVNIVLFIIYIFLFGIQSISKYFDNGVTIITHEVKPLNMIPPGKFTKKNILYDTRISGPYGPSILAPAGSY